VGDLILSTLAAHNAATALADIHGFQELLLSVHALELHVGVTATCGVVRLVILSFGEDFFGLALRLPDHGFQCIDVSLNLEVRRVTGWLSPSIVASLSNLLLIANQSAHALI